VHAGFCGGNLGERDHLEDPCRDGRIILRWIFRNWGGGWGVHGPDSSDSEYEKLLSFCECDNESSGSI